MLDTNSCGYIIREKPVYIKEKLKKISSKHEIALSSIVVSELLYGVKRRQSQKLAKVVNSFIDNFTIYDFDERSAYEYAKIRFELEKNGQIIGSNDLFIASHAKATKAILVTNNTKEFKRVSDLDMENWIEETI